MSSAETVVTEAFKAINAIDINETAPSPAEAAAGLARLNRMIDSWQGQGLNTATVAMAADVTLDSPTITVASTRRLAPGLNVTGTGVTGRILSIDSPTQFTLDADATAGGSSVTLTFTALPFQPKFELGVIALLAMRLAVSADDVPPWVAQDAHDGWLALQANFIVVPSASFDLGLTNTSLQSRVSSGAFDGNG